MMILADLNQRWWFSATVPGASSLSAKSLLLGAAFSERTFTLELGPGYPRQLRFRSRWHLRTSQTDSGPSVFTLLLESSVMLSLS
jgi:hypothetical protein